jgi:hypothetical protein
VLDCIWDSVAVLVWVGIGLVIFLAMSMEPLFQVGWNKGELDFRVRCDVRSLSIEEMNKVRAMTMAGIGIMEDMFRSSLEERYPPQVGTGR